MTDTADIDSAPDRTPPIRLTRTRIPGTITGALPAVPASVAIARNSIGELARELGAEAGAVEDIKLVISEAVSNAVVHAYQRGTPGLVHFTAVSSDRELVVGVADDGCGLSSPACSPGLGVGLKLIADLASQSMAVERPTGGTIVQLRFALRQPIAA